MALSNTPDWQDISVVIVVFNSEHVIAQSLTSVKNAAQVILVDNASTDRTVEIARQTLPSVQVIQNPINMGYGTANNIGFEAITTPYGMILNPDAVMTEGAIQHLRAHLEADPACAVCAPLLKSPEGKLELYVMGFQERRHHPMTALPQGPFCTGFIMGAAMLWRMSAWRQLGGFDEAIFLYGEDTDLGLRTIQAGHTMIIEPASIVRHLGGQSERPSKEQQWRRNWQMTWGGLYVSSKWVDKETTRKDARTLICKHGLKALVYIFLLRFNRFHTNYARAHAAWTFLFGHPSWPGRN